MEVEDVEEETMTTTTITKVVVEDVEEETMTTTTISI